MAVSGKYDFQGIKKYGAAGLRLALSNSFVAPILGYKVTETLLEFLVNWLANRGLIVLNVGANYLVGEFDQKQFDGSLDEAIREITLAGGRDKLTAKQNKGIDDAVLKAARKFIVIGRP